jgi:tetratricopeptide (TPR) repeat protein
LTIAYKQGDWDEAIAALLNVIQVEPDAAFAYYYLSEAYRFKKISETPCNTKAINKNETFGAAYGACARTRLLGDPNGTCFRSWMKPFVGPKLWRCFSGAQVRLRTMTSRRGHRFG